MEKPYSFSVPVSEAQDIYANRKNGRVRLLLMPGSHDEYAEMERHIGTVIGFLDEALQMERVKGIEPSYAAWEAAVLPLNYARKCVPDGCAFARISLFSLPEIATSGT